MILTLKGIRGWAVQHGEDAVGVVLDVVFDAEKGMILAYWTMTEAGLRLLLANDIWRFREENMSIMNQDDLLLPEELPRLQPIIDASFRVLGLPIYATDAPQKRLGRVKDLTWQSQDHRLRSIIIESGWGFWKTERPILRERIMKISEDSVLIDEPKVVVGSRHTPSVDV
jgi:uncharacterized protein YrrD